VNDHYAWIQQLQNRIEKLEMANNRYEQVVPQLEAKTRDQAASIGVLVELLRDANQLDPQEFEARKRAALIDAEHAVREDMRDSASVWDSAKPR
jgi:hypothetical protein